jgi:hypothetical protein
MDLFANYDHASNFYAAYLGDLLEHASVADLPYTKMNNQQSYQQLLWKTLPRKEIFCPPEFFQ